MLCTLVTPTGGRAEVAGYDVVRQRDEVRRNIGLVFQDPTLDGYLTAERNLRLHAELYGMPAGRWCPTGIARRCSRWSACGTAARTARSTTFSGGMKRRLEIARGLLHSPRVLFLDEPTVGLDPQTRSSIWAYIHELEAAEDITIFLTTHYMDEAEYCDRIAIMDHGRDHRPGHPRGAQGQRRQGPRPDPHRRRPSRHRRAAASSSTSRQRLPRGQVTFSVERGEEFVPRLFAELAMPIRSVSVARPTLDDVFMSYTGSTIRDAEAIGSDINAAATRCRCSGQAGDDRGPSCRSRRSGSRTRSWSSELRAVKIVCQRELIRFGNDRLRMVTSLVQPILFLFVLGSGLSRLTSGGTGGLSLRTFLYPGILAMAVMFTAHVLGGVDRLGPRVRLPARDARRPGAPQLDRHRQVPRRRDGGGVPGRHRHRASPAWSGFRTTRR